MFNKCRYDDIFCSINSSKEWIIYLTPIAVNCHAIILLSWLRPLVVSSRFELMFVVRLAVLISMLRGSGIYDNRRDDGSGLVITWAALVLSYRCVTTLPFILVIVIVPAISINHTLSSLAKSAHFIWLILNNARWIRKVLYGMPLEGICRML